jgi:hypothetical protein
VASRELPTVFRKATPSNPTNNVLRIFQSDDVPPFPGFPECSGDGDVSADVNVGTLVAGTVPRYKLTLVTDLEGVT